MFPDQLNSTTLLPPALQAKSPNKICFLTAKEPQVQVQPVIEQILAGIPITINYFSSAQVEQL